MRICVLIVALLAVPATASADDDHTVYVEAFGRGGLYGIGYDYQLSLHLSVGVTVSAYRMSGETIATATPYFGLYLVRGEHHGWFAQLGPQLSRITADSPISTWDGASRTGFGAQLTSGWEYRNRIVVRSFATLTAGRGGIAPWAGASIGVEF